VKTVPLPVPVRRRKPKALGLASSAEWKARTERFLRQVARENAKRGPVFASTNPYAVLADSRKVAPIATAELSARRYLASERRWAPYLARRGADSHRTGRDVLDLAKARAARHRRASGAYVHGSHPTPKGRYSADELIQLGKEGKALQLPNGSYGYVVQNLADLMNALAAYKDPRFKNHDGKVRSWIVSRVILLGLVDQLPVGWAQPANNKPGPRETEAV
jgi:hypothetical protein